MSRWDIGLGDVVRIENEPVEYTVKQLMATVGIISDDDRFLLQMGDDGTDIRWKKRQELILVSKTSA